MSYSMFNRLFDHAFGDFHVKTQLFLCLLGLVFIYLCFSPSKQDAVEADAKERIVSLAPSLTETLFALELGDSIVADTVYCETPEAAKALPKVGAWNDVNIEQVLSFQPTCVCLPATHPCRAKFEQMNIPLCAVDGRSLDNVIEGIELLGTRFDRKERAHELASDMRRRLQALKKAYEGRRHLKVMVVVGRARGAGRVKNLTVVGDDAYFRPLLSIVGCDVLPAGGGIPYPAMSIEGVMAVSPEAVVEIAADCAADGGKAAMADWKTSFPKLVARGAVFVFTENYATVPGLRSVLFAEQLARRLENVRKALEESR